MTANDYARLKEQVETEYRQNLEAIERVWRLAQGPDAARVPASSNADADHKPAEKPAKAKNGAIQKGKLQTAARQAVLQLAKKRFTSRDMEDQLKTSHPGLGVKKSSLKGALKKLVGDGLIEIVVMGKGRTPTQFRRTSMHAE